MIGAPFSSFGMSAELAVLCAVNACSNSVAAVGGSHVPAGLATSLYLSVLNSGFRTPL